MQQTILGLGALMIITMLSVQQQKASMYTLEGIYVKEIENAAADYAKKRTEEIVNSVAFDESRLGSSDLDVDTGTLTSIISLGPDSGENDQADYDDLDDYHDLEEDIIHILSADTFRFNVTYEVNYINPASPSSTPLSPTLAKEFSILVVSQDAIGGRAAQFAMSKTILVSDNL